MNIDRTPALLITAKPKAFKGHKVARSLSQIAQLSSTAHLGSVIDKPKYTLLNPRKKCTLKIFFESADDLVDFQRRTIFKEQLKQVLKHCQNEGIETVTL